MAGKSKFITALNDINAFFAGSQQKVFKETDLKIILDKNRGQWGLPYGMSTKKFLEELLKHTDFKIAELVASGKPSYASDRIIRYSYGGSIFEIALSIRSKAYLSHYSSVFLHGLTQQIPKTIYVTFEQSQKIDTQSERSPMEQSAIDQAFSKPQREPSHFYSYLDYRIVPHNGMFTKHAGVSRLDSHFGQNILITNLERTLIDIAVRPSYSGGINVVLTAYREAKNSLSVNKMSALLSRINYKYPYHQAIGFYLEKAGFKESQINSFKSFPQNNDF